MSRTAETIKAVSLQLPSSKRYQENLDTLLEYLQTYNDSELIVTPEVYFTAYDYEHMETAAMFSANVLKALKKEIEDQVLVVTLLLKEEDGFVNRAAVIHKHKVVYQQDKVKLFRLGKEDQYLKAGKERKVKLFEINGIKYAMLICFELRFKELWKNVEGADVVLIPARWGLPRKKHLEILSRALAVMNQCYVVVSNSADIDMAGASAIIAPNGEFVQDDTKDAVEGSVSLSEIKKMRRYIVMD